MKQRTLAVVSAGLSQPSSSRLLADQLTAATRRRLDGQGVELDVRPYDLREYGHDLINNLLTGFPSAALAPVIEAVTAADGLIAVSPIFNASYSGLFKSFFDVLAEESLMDKPVLIGATGGTARHSLALEHALRPMFVYLRAIVMPTSVFAGPEDWAGAVTEAALGQRIELAAGQLAESIERGEPVTATDPYALTTSFDQLLGGD